MIQQQGRILSRQGSQATILLGSTSGCPACDAGKGCGAGIFGRLVIRKPIELDLENPENLLAGKAVLVGIPESFFLGLLARFYLMPLLAGLAGGILGQYVAQNMGLSSIGQDLSALTGALFLSGLTLFNNLAGNHWRDAQARVSLLGYPPVQSEQLCRPGSH